MNAVSALHNYCQQHCYRAPTYSFEKRGKKDHEPEWRSSLCIAMPREKSYTGDWCQTKQEAKNSAAFKAFLDTNGNPVVLDLPLIKEAYPIVEELHCEPVVKACAKLVIDDDPFEAAPRVAILIDVENKPNFVKEMPLKIFKQSNVTCYAFISEHNSMSTRLVYPHEVIILQTPCNLVDAADTYMVMTAATWLHADLYDVYMIVTADKFGNALCEHIRAEGLGWEAKKAFLVTQVSQLTNHLYRL